jgi:hypothetical protein
MTGFCCRQAWRHKVCVGVGVSGGLQVRSAATAALQSAAVSAEAVGVLPGSIERGLRERLLPPLETLSRKVSGKAQREVPQVNSPEQLMRSGPSLHLAPCLAAWLPAFFLTAAAAVDQGSCSMWQFFVAQCSPG